MTRLLVLIALAAGLAACSEPSQDLRSGHAIQDDPAWQGTGSNFVASDWTPGDQRNWEQALKVRLQRGQNEYNRVR